MYQNKQTMMMNQIIGQLNQIVTKLQEQDRTIESLNLRLDDMSSRMPAGRFFRKQSFPLNDTFTYLLYDRQVSAGQCGARGKNMGEIRPA